MFSINISPRDVLAELVHRIRVWLKQRWDAEATFFAEIEERGKVIHEKGEGVKN